MSRALDTAEAERDDAIRTAQDNAAEVDKLRMLINAVLDCPDLEGWSGENASPLYDRLWTATGRVPNE